MTAIDLFDPPSLEELEALHGPLSLAQSRALTAQEREQASVAKGQKKHRHLETKRKSEAIVKRQWEKWGAALAKARDDLITLKTGQQVRVSKDVDFVGSIPLRLNGSVRTVPLKVESKGITLKKGKGSFPLSNLSDKERRYLSDHRAVGGLAVVHLCWWEAGECVACHIVNWKQWEQLEAGLLAMSDGKFSGKSLRYHADLMLLVGCGVVKEHGRWKLEADHWLHELLAYGQAPLLF